MLLNFDKYSAIYNSTFWFKILIIYELNLHYMHTVDFAFTIMDGFLLNKLSKIPNNLRDFDVLHWVIVDIVKVGMATSTVIPDAVRYFPYLSCFGIH